MGLDIVWLDIKVEFVLMLWFLDFVEIELVV